MEREQAIRTALGAARYELNQRQAEPDRSGEQDSAKNLSSAIDALRIALSLHVTEITDRNEMLSDKAVSRKQLDKLDDTPNSSHEDIAQS